MIHHVAIASTVNVLHLLLAGAAFLQVLSVLLALLMCERGDVET
jgi:hypothetical protein